MTILNTRCYIKIKIQKKMIYKYNKNLLTHGKKNKNNLKENSKTIQIAESKKIFF